MTVCSTGTKCFLPMFLNRIFLFVFLHYSKLAIENVIPQSPYGNLLADFAECFKLRLNGHINGHTWFEGMLIAFYRYLSRTLE